ALLCQRTATDAASMAWVDELVGRYECAELGPGEITKRDGSYWIQFQEWGSSLGCQIQDGGDRLIRLLSPPWRGAFQMLVTGRDLRLDAAQNQYTFQRVK